MAFSEALTKSEGNDKLDHWPILIPKEAKGIWIPQNFRNAVLLHVVKNYISGLNPPLILGIQGKKGEGKSFQTREVCSQMGVYLIPVSGSLLSGTFERAAVEVLSKAYIFASSVRTSVKKMTVLLIDDFDLSVASTFDDRRYTVNSQLLAGFVMNLADDPTICDGKKTHRIPVIVTGNNFTYLHGPLTRHGRMNFFDWAPSVEDKTQIVASIFNSILERGEISRIKELVESYPDQPISFFAALIDDLVNEFILQTIDDGKGINLSSLQNTVSKALKNQSVTKLTSLASVRQSMQPQNFTEL